MNPKRVTFLRRWAHDEIRGAERMLSAEQRNPSARGEIVVASQEVKIKTLETLLLLLKDNIGLENE